MVVSGVKGSLATGVDLLYEQLLISSLDEPSAEYGLIAEAVSYSSDFSTASFRLRPQARWHDGRSITPHDIVFSFHAFKKHSPQLSTYYRLVNSVEVTGEHEVTFRALDRTLLWHHYVVPQWTYANVRTARWNCFAKPKVMPIYGNSAFPTIWWWDAERASQAGSEN